MQGTEGSTRRWKFIKVTDSQPFDWESFDTTCKVIQLVYQEKVLLTLSENYHKIYLLDKVPSSGLAFYIEIGTHWKYHKLLSMNLLKLFLLFCITLLECTLKLFMGIHSTQRDRAEKNKPWNAISMNVRFSASILLLYKSAWMAPQQLSTQAFLSSVSC